MCGASRQTRTVAEGRDPEPLKKLDVVAGRILRQ